MKKKLRSEICYLVVDFVTRKFYCSTVPIGDGIIDYEYAFVAFYPPNANKSCKTHLNRYRRPLRAIVNKVANNYECGEPFPKR